MAQTRLTLCAVFVVAAVVIPACGGNTPVPPTSPVAPVVLIPVAPLTPAAKVRVWSGAFNIASCSGSSCTTAPVSFVLRLAPDDTGVLQIDAKVWSQAPAIALSVSAVKSGTLTVVTGSAAPGGLAPALDARLELSTVSDTLEGTVRYTVTGSGGTTTKTGSILHANADPTTYVAAFQGDWQGFVARACSGDCTYSDPVLPNAGVQLRISHAGEAVSLRLAGNEIPATLNGNTISATYRYSVPAGGCKAGWDDGTYCVIEVTLSATADELSRLRGTITYRVEAVDYRNRPIAFSASAAFDGVARWR